MRGRLKMGTPLKPHLMKYICMAHDISRFDAYGQDIDKDFSNKDGTSAIYLEDKHFPGEIADTQMALAKHKIKREGFFVPSAYIWTVSEHCPLIKINDGVTDWYAIDLYEAKIDKVIWRVPEMERFVTSWEIQHIHGFDLLENVNNTINFFIEAHKKPISFWAKYKEFCIKNKGIL
jgi:hypothetical protein